ncbi:ScbR family autoregulator-binding transcription factor [Streptomyces sp. NPDC059690]|uniref:ScbR family autoregulator-binding transcription factor n=1 Tax=Streptomyces gilvifuscus TaxID=1550617 RepID=A0ABT5FWW0_9ACTN|nr:MULTISPECIES: ScbR family autoregulator-binding transcription factor [Streptomyces]MBK3644986.1 TetR/AcrR family transcriptional regulator [Streptomyces sp. MBT33]MDC2956926.1 ScbR family autoregulator-binding transcription factor [Streptomyces gilvifuscus]TQJ90711.1 TetR family transcriptional regulator [Streptomyces sp. SLBN-31]
MARQLRAEQTRATIITAAAELFDRRGYESTSLSDIVEHAQVTKGALYFHFAAKEDLAHAIMELQSKASREVANEVESRGYSSLETLMRITFGISRMSVEGPIQRAGLRLATGPVEVRPPLAHPFTEWRDLASRKLHGAVKESDIHPDIDIEATAHALVSWFVGTRVVGRTLEPVARQPRRVAEMWQVMIRGLVPVTRRARYLSLAARLEREPRTV